MHRIAWSHSRRGLGTGSVLLVVLMLLTLAVAGGRLFMQTHLELDRYQNRQDAKLLAETALARVVHELYANPEYGQAAMPAMTVNVTAQGLPEGAFGQVTFHPATATASGCPVSLHNLGKPARPGYQQRLIPQDGIQLVGLGRCANAEQVVVATLTAPPFPFALTACGPLQAKGGVKVAGLPALPAAGQAVDEDELRSASLLCNAAGAEAVLLGADTHVYGQVRAVGAVVQEAGVRVDGGVRPVERSDPQALTLSDYDPKSLPHVDLEGSLTASGTVTGVLRREGSLAVDGNLKLRNTLLFVDGDLTVDGGVSGDGLIVCTGKVTFKGATSLESGTGVALLAGGDIRLTGAGASGSYFKGLVYTDAGFEASQVSVLGAMVTRGTEPVVLDQARVLMPENLPGNVTWQGGSQRGPDPAVTYTSYELNLAPVSDASWNRAYVYEKHERTPGDPASAFYRRFTFRKAGSLVDPTPADVSEYTPSQLTNNVDAATQARLTDPSFPTMPDLGTPPPPPPADPQHPGPAGWTVGPSQFYSLARRLRVLLWQPA